MWGNSLGWLMSAGMVIFTIVIGSRIYSSGQISDATDFSAGDNLKVLEPPVPDGVITQSDEGDAGAIYHSAIKNYKEGATERFVMDPTGTPPPAVGLILNAAHKSQHGIFAAAPDEVINYDVHHDSLDTLKELGDEVIKIGMSLMKKGDKEKAGEYFDAAYALGWNLSRERLVHDEYVYGESLMEAALQEMGSLSPDNAEKRAGEFKALQEYDAAHVEPIYRGLTNINLSQIDFHAGDYYRLAAKAKDPLVRVEAILAIGRLRFDATRAADQDSAMKAVTKYAEDADPAIKAAGKAARDLTVEKYRMLGG